MKLKMIYALFLAFLIMGCGDKTQEISEDKFIGLWELKGRGMFDGIQIRIEKDNGKLIGKIAKLNNNKLVKMFAEVNDVWVSDIKRQSNFEFKITEKKIAKDLFSLYNIASSEEFEAEFIDDKTIGLGTGISSAQNSKIKYTRVD